MTTTPYKFHVFVLSREIPFHSFLSVPVPEIVPGSLFSEVSWGQRLDLFPEVSSAKTSDETADHPNEHEVARISWGSAGDWICTVIARMNYPEARPESISPSCVAIPK